MTRDITEDLEAMIDRHGLLHVITALTCVCGEKADHIRANWQDRNSALVWQRASNLIDTVARKIDQLGI